MTYGVPNSHVANHVTPKG